MNEGSNKAVFLSYASQDAEAAKKIRDALRAQGVEVWFDQSELRGGDAWDQSIRRQIKECGLFIPVVSANTQARREGYFRLEWKLADDRTHLMAKGTRFILPVCVDDTKDWDAIVPDSFTTVQWTRLRPAGFGGQALDDSGVAAFAERVKKLLNGGGPVGAASRRDGAEESRREAAPTRKPFRRWLVPAIFGAAAIVALAVWQPWRKNEKPVATTPSSPPALSQSSGPALSQSSGPALNLPNGPALSQSNGPVLSLSNGLSEARQLAAKARLLFGALETTRDDCALADDLLKQALAKDGADAEIWGAEAQLHEYYILRGWDTSDTRRELARSAAQRAIRLDPQSFEARIAQVNLLDDTGRDAAEKERLLRELRRERPDDRRVLRALGNVVDRQGRIDESAALLDESAALPGGDPVALYDKSLNFWFVGRTTEAETAIRAALAQRPFNSAWLISAWYATLLHGDLAAGRAALDKIAPWVLQEDRGCFFSYYVDYLRRAPDDALARLRALPRDWLNDSWYRGPKGRLAGDALRLAGRADAATIEWRAALKLVDARLATEPTDSDLLYNRVLLLASLGEPDAARQFSALLQMTGIDLGLGKAGPSWVTDICITLGRKADAMRQIALNLKLERHAVNFTAARLKLDPLFDPLRDEPGFAELIAQAEAAEKSLGDGGSAGPKVLMDPQKTGPSAPKVDDKSIAVLPFENMSDDKDTNAFFAEGIHEDILTHLSNIREMRVVSRTSVMQYRATIKPIPQIARELGVAYILEGSVRRAGNKVRVTGQLINARTDEHVWAKAYDRDLTDIFAIQAELSQEIATALQAAISPQEKTLLERRPTENLAAYELVLKARELGNQPKWSRERLLEAERLLRGAVQLDPNYAVAYADLTYICAYAHYFSDPNMAVDSSAGWITKAKEAMEIAVRLAPDSPDTIRAQGDYFYYAHRDYARATVQYERLIRLRPNDATPWLRLAAIQRRQSHWSESLASFRKADELDPGNLRNIRDLGILLAAVRRFDEAIVQQRRIVERLPDDIQAGFELAELSFLGRGSPQEMEQFFARLPPARRESPEGIIYRKRWALFHGDLAEAIRLDRQQPYSDGFTRDSQAIDMAVALAVQGDLAAARARLENLPATLRANVESEPQDWASWIELARVEAILGRREEAQRCARKAVELEPETLDALVGAVGRANLAFVLAWTGDKDAAIAEYGRVLQTPYASVNGAGGSYPDTTVHMMKLDPHYAPLRGDPRFEALLNDPKNNAPLF